MWLLPRPCDARHSLLVNASLMLLLVGWQAQGPWPHPQTSTHKITHCSHALAKLVEVYTTTHPCTKAPHG